MASPGFRANPELYDVLKLAGIQVPGQWECPQLGRALDVKAPKSDGKDDGSIRIAGMLPTAGTIAIKLDTDDEESQWEQLRARIFPLDRPSARNEVLVDNVHFARNGIRSIIVTAIDDPPSKGGAEQHVAIHWRSAKTTSIKSTTRKPKSAANQKLELRPSALVDTPASQVAAAGGR